MKRLAPVLVALTARGRVFVTNFISDDGKPEPQIGISVDPCGNSTEQIRYRLSTESGWGRGESIGRIVEMPQTQGLYLTEALEAIDVRRGGGVVLGEQVADWMLDTIRFINPSLVLAG